MKIQQHQSKSILTPASGFVASGPHLFTHSLSANRAHVPGIDRREHESLLLRTGFKFQFPDWPAAAEDLAQQWKNRD